MAHKLGDFQNYFIDWLCIDRPYKNLRNELQLNRPQLAKILKISPHSIRRYETDNNAPHWYLMILRVLCGDLSLYGYDWIDCRIQAHDKKLRSPLTNNPISIKELDMRYNAIVLNAQNNAREAREQLRAAEKKLEASQNLNNELTVKIEILERRINHLLNVEKSIKKGKIIPMFSKK